MVSDKMSLVAKDIIMMKVKPEDTLQSLSGKFYKILRKHNIKQMTTVDGGKTYSGNNFEYTMSKTLFVKMVCHSFDFMEWGIGGWKNIPKNVAK
jgi:hypothetical protein